MTNSNLFMAALAASLLATSAIGETITASAKDVSVTWQPDAQTVETRSSADAYTHAAYELRPINKKGTVPIQRIELNQAAATLSLRTVGQHVINGQACDADCIYLFPGVDYKLRVTMYRGNAPKISVPVGVVKVDTNGVAVRRQASVVEDSIRADAGTCPSGAKDRSIGCDVKPL